MSWVWSVKSIYSCHFLKDPFFTFYSHLHLDLYHTLLQALWKHVWAGYVNRYSDWLRAGRSGIESQWGRHVPPVETGPGAHPASCKMGTGSFPGLKCGWGVLLTTHLLLVPLDALVVSLVARHWQPRTSIGDDKHKPDSTGITWIRMLPDNLYN